MGGMNEVVFHLICQVSEHRSGKMMLKYTFQECRARQLRCREADVEQGWFFDYKQPVDSLLVLLALICSEWSIRR